MDWPVSGGRPGDFTSVFLQANSTPNSKGSWTQAITAISSGAHALCFQPQGYQDGGANFFMDIGVGPAASEVTLIPDVHFGGKVATTHLPQEWGSFYLPVNLVAGERLAMRLQSDVASAGAVITVTLTPLALPAPAPFGPYEAFGKGANTKGTACVTGSSGSPNGGGWTQLISTTSRTYRWIQLVGGGDDTVQDVRATVTLGVGGSGLEVAFASMQGLFRPTASGTRDSLLRSFFYGPCHIPNGSRLSARLTWLGGFDSQTIYLCGLGG